MLIFECCETIESNLVKLETSRTVILPPTESVLWHNATYLGSRRTKSSSIFYLNLATDLSTFLETFFVVAWIGQKERERERERVSKVTEVRFVRKRKLFFNAKWIHTKCHLKWASFWFFSINLIVGFSGIQTCIVRLKRWPRWPLPHNRHCLK